MARFEETFPPYFPLGSRTLTLGATGTDVAVVQALYNLLVETMNPPQGPIGPAITISGHYDVKTAGAVKALQSYFGLAVDGVVGPVTYFTLGQGVGAYVPYGGPAYGSRELSFGVSGGDVTVLQNRLNCYRYAALLGAPASGTFDARTEDAVRAFKEDAETNGDTGFPPGSVAGAGVFDATWLYTAAGGRNLVSGRRGVDVVFVQALLQDLGYYAGRLTGYYDALTESAVVAFQRASGIRADGVVGPMTFYHLGLNNATPAPSPLSIVWPAGPSPTVSVCSVALLSQTANLHPYGVASLVINEAEGFESLDVVGNFLNPPGTFGNFSSYAFTLTDPLSGEVLETIPMVRTSTTTNPGDWAGSFSPGVKTIPQGVVTVYPYNRTTGSLGAPVLQGSLANCH
ncbi:MAG: peptidoglycan-binding protein [Firmicutes bacterium]|nr:peptidoglycan-binding protein [Bacillota bacterium]